jgi:hypothetical protein
MKTLRVLAFYISTALALFVQVEESTALLTEPSGLGIFSYAACSTPIVSDDPALAAPVGFGAAAEGGPTVSVLVALTETESVDLYFAVVVPGGEGELFFWSQEGTFLPFGSSGLVAWKRTGKYTFFFAATPSGRPGDMHLWMTELTLPGSSSEITITARYGKSVRGSADGFPLLILRGTHTEHGKAHGFLSAKEIISSIETMAGFIDRSGSNWDDFVAGVKRFTFPERFEQELGGMLSGIHGALGVPAQRIVPALKREVGLDDLKVLQCGDLFELAKCSQFSAWGPFTSDREVIVGRNFDYPPLFPTQNPVVLAVEPADGGESGDRYRKIEAALKVALAQGTKIGFDEARAIMSSVSKDTTLYSVVAWPGQRKLMVATSPDVGVSATTGIYVTLEWNAIFQAE